MFLVVVATYMDTDECPALIIWNIGQLTLNFNGWWHSTKLSQLAEILFNTAVSSITFNVKNGVALIAFFVTFFFQEVNFVASMPIFYTLIV